MNTARLRVGPPCTRDQRSAASLDTVRHEQRSSEKRGHIYPTGSLTKGGHEAHRFPCCSARYCRPPSKPQRTRRTALLIWNPHPQTEAQGDELGAYDESLRQRGSLTVWFTDEAIAAWRAAPRTTRGGQPWYSPLAIVTALTLRAVFRLALRQTEGLIGSIIRLLGLTLAVPDHSTLSRRAQTLDVPRPHSGSGAVNQPVHLLVDSTGLKLCGAGEWLFEKHGTRTR